MSNPSIQGNNRLPSMVSDYGVISYSQMIDDPVRINAYSAALYRAIKPNSVVLDIGAGTGFFSLLACKYGAKKVYAVEPGESILLAKQVAQDSGCDNRIEFIQDVSTQVILDQRVDVVISDLRGRSPLFENHIATIVDMRTRLLRSDGIQIPEQDDIWVALVNSPEAYCSTVKRAEKNDFGFDLSRLSTIASNTMHERRIRTEEVVTEPQRWATIDYRTITSPNVTGKMSWEVDSQVTVHGIVMWFDANLLEGITFSNAPGEIGSIHGHVFIPWTNPVELLAGDQVNINIDAKFVRGDYIWRWRTDITDRSGSVRESFDQSTFKTLLQSMSSLRRRSKDHQTQLTQQGCVQLVILEKLKEGVSLGGVAEQLMVLFPDFFPDQGYALHMVADVADAYGV